MHLHFYFLSFILQQYKFRSGYPFLWVARDPIPYFFLQKKQTMTAVFAGGDVQTVGYWVYGDNLQFYVYFRFTIKNM